MFTDMVGYTALMQQDEARAKSQRDRQRSVLEDRIVAHEGEILQFYGDGTLSVFGSAVQAVHAAMEIQTALAAEPRVPLRIGIHTGDVVRDDEGVFGDGVNVAARIQGLAAPGSVLVSDKLQDELKNHADIAVRYLGEFSLKNVARDLGVYALANAGLTIPDPGELATARSLTARSVAVLPFVNMSSDPENEFFADGISEEVINALTRVPGLQVTARTSSFAFKGQNRDVREIAGQLQVATVLEGSVRRAGNRVRIAAQLINARDGYHLFSEVYDRPLDDIFATQDELARTIVAELERHFDADEGAHPSATSDVRRTGSSSDGPMDPAVQRVHSVTSTGAGHVHDHGGGRLVRRHTHDTEAYTEYLKGRFHWNRWTPQDAMIAIRHLERSAELDPSCALPFSALATTYTFLASIGYMPAEDAYPRAAAYAREALSLEDDGGEGHLALGGVKFFYEWDFEAAEQCFSRALELMPGSADAHHLYGMFLKAVGRHDEAVSHLRAAVKIDPLSLPLNHALGVALFAADRVEDAEAQIQHALELDPHFRAAIEIAGWLRLRKGDMEGALGCFEQLPALARIPGAGAAHRGYTLARMGRLQEAEEMLELVRRRRREEPSISLRMDFALIHAGLGDLDETFRQLNLAIDERLGGIVFLNTSPNWKHIRKDPRFDELISRIGIPEPSAVR